MSAPAPPSRCDCVDLIGHSGSWPCGCESDRIHPVDLLTAGVWHYAGQHWRSDCLVAVLAATPTPVAFDEAHTPIGEGHTIHHVTVDLNPTVPDGPRSLTGLDTHIDVDRHGQVTAFTVNWADGSPPPGDEPDRAELREQVRGELAGVDLVDGLLAQRRAAAEAEDAAAEIAAYEANPIDEPDDWGDMGAWQDAAAAEIARGRAGYYRRLVDDPPNRPAPQATTRHTWEHEAVAEGDIVQSHVPVSEDSVVHYAAVRRAASGSGIRTVINVDALVDVDAAGRVVGITVAWVDDPHDSEAGPA